MSLQLSSSQLITIATTRRVLFELDGIPERELDKLEQDEERFEKSSLRVHLLHGEAEGGVEVRSENHLQRERVLQRQVALHRHRYSWMQRLHQEYDGRLITGRRDPYPGTSQKKNH